MGGIAMNPGSISSPSPGGQRSTTVETFKAQLRIHFSEGLAQIARRDPADLTLAPLNAVLARHGATMKCQFDAFMEYVMEAETQGVEAFALYRWTKDTVENPVKRKKHLAVFAIHVGGEEIYPKEAADALEADLTPLVDGVQFKRLAKYDTHPANNPQPPAS
jgi:hypothetical protein